MVTFSPYSYRRLCHFAIIRTNEPTRGLVNTVSCGSRKHREEWTNQNAWKRAFCADWLILPLLPKRSRGSRRNTPFARIRIFLKPHIFLLESVLWAHKANDSAHSSAVYARTKCAILYIFADACGRGLGSSLKAADAERYHDAESGEKKWKFLISTSVLVSVHNNTTQ